MKLSIIIPTFNEEKTIAEVIKKVAKVKLPKKITKEIIVVDDGSTDNSQNEIKKNTLKDLKFVIHEKNLGKGAAVRTGINIATGDFVIIQDADLEYDPHYYQYLLEPILNKECEVVFGTRLKNYPLNLWGKNKTVLPTHLIANRFLTTLTNILYGSNLTDMETGYKLFPLKKVKALDLKEQDFGFEPEITVKLLKKAVKILEIPIETKPRSYKEGKKIGFKDGLKAVWLLFKYKFIN